ncbi:hypothetical protein LPAF129_04030 [Ligilactobacillus pabuli]|uniref:Uncharacterized protein n=1 Tax=Ligilactobacillus pabuli TaxID=2886039 RepID=A0ABQ5JG90_9LACO|nr:hypothetical protein [Ligilactobacillus pabuli]GKS80718.1 hypothetical protein LPAF129_04030 [Ligilactobacillus pabuli]
MKKTLKQQLTGMKPTTECHVQFTDMRFCDTVSELLQDERIQQYKDNLVTRTRRQHVAGRHYVEIYVGRAK